MLFFGSVIVHLTPSIILTFLLRVHLTLGSYSSITPKRSLVANHKEAIITSIIEIMISDDTTVPCYKLKSNHHYLDSLMKENRSYF